MEWWCGSVVGVGGMMGWWGGGDGGVGEMVCL